MEMTPPFPVFETICKDLASRQGLCCCSVPTQHPAQLHPFLFPTGKQSLIKELSWGSSRASYMAAEKTGRVLEVQQAPQLPCAPWHRQPCARHSELGLYQWSELWLPLQAH